MSRSEAEEAKARAEARFKEKQGLSETVPTARDVADRELAAAKEKTGWLRAMRLAKEQSDHIAATIRKERRQRPV